MIPKKIFSIWLNDTGYLPHLVEKCHATQQALEQHGYEYNLITLENCDRSSQYVRDCIDAKKWVKASDYLRMLYLFKEGGIYLDSDMEIIKPFDDLLNTKLAVFEERNGCFANSVVGAVAGHGLIGEYLRRVESNFKGAGDLVFEPGLRAFSDLVWISNREEAGITVYNSEYFFPFRSEDKQGEITHNTRGIHHWLHSWK